MPEESRNYIGYEYKEFTAESSEASRMIDCYGSFGWKQDENLGMTQNTGQVRIRLKRDRKIMNKAELTRLQRHFEDSIKQVRSLENSKTSSAVSVSLIIGILGTACMAGSVFAVTAPNPVIWLCILFSVPGFAGWILPYFVYKRMIQVKSEKLAPMIEAKFDEIYEICEKGNKLL